MDSLADIVEAADSPWGIVALIVLGLYVLMWKYGGTLLQLQRETRDASVHVKEAIITNQGSKNLGDAIDKLTEALDSAHTKIDTVHEATKTNRDLIDEVNASLLRHSAESRRDHTEKRQQIAALSARLDEHIKD